MTSNQRTSASTFRSKWHGGRRVVPRRIDTSIRRKFLEVFIDGPSNIKGTGVGIIMFTIDGGMIE